LADLPVCQGFGGGHDRLILKAEGIVVALISCFRPPHSGVGESRSGSSINPSREGFSAGFEAPADQGHEIVEVQQLVLWPLSLRPSP